VGEDAEVDERKAGAAVVELARARASSAAGPPTAPTGSMVVGALALVVAAYGAFTFWRWGRADVRA
jgi:hypothetical protein